MNKQIWSWAFYDFANTAFSALFVTLFYPLFVKAYLGGNEFHIGIVMGGSMFLVGVLVPIIGVIADLTGRRVRMVSIFTLACVIACALVAWANLWMALLLGFIANFTYHACLVVYNSILPQLASERSQGRISGFGIALGYAGTFCSIIMAGALLSQLGWETYAGVASIFPATAFFYMAFSMLLFTYVPDVPKKHTKVWSRLIKLSVREVWSTVRNIRTYIGLLPFLLSSFLYSNGTTAAIIFLYLYAREEMQLGVQTFLWIYIIFSIASAIGALIAGRLSDRIGPRNTLVIAGFGWLATIMVLMNPTGLDSFIVAGCIGGLSLGTIWTANRPMVLDIVKREKPGQFFGYNELADKFSGVLAPPLFGWLVVEYNYNAALASLLVFFGLGLLLLYWVPGKR